ncbi:MAG: glycosylhydrolase-like jelly roll fold domain-containing protein [bacterium]
MQFTVHDASEWLYKSEFGKTADFLWARGYTFDFVSDRLLTKFDVDNGQLISGNSTWRALVIPGTGHIPVETMEKILSLAKKGAVVIFEGGIPSDVPGYGNLEQRRDKLKQLIRQSGAPISSKPEMSETKTGGGLILIGNNIEDALLRANVKREQVVDNGIKFIRRINENGNLYFMSNLGAKPLDGWVQLAVEAKSAMIFDPLHYKKGIAKTRRDENSNTQVYLQLEPGESLILQTFNDAYDKEDAWKYISMRKEPFEITGEWNVKFIEGGAIIPEERKISKLISWTEFGGKNEKYFSGTGVYSIDFQMPAFKADDWMIDLGRVAESARVRLNGHEIGTVWSAPFRIPAYRFVKEGANKLEIEVTNLSANRIISLEKRGARWKYFRDANIVDVNYKSFDASNWQPMESGLIGPVRLYPVSYY